MNRRRIRRSIAAVAATLAWVAIVAAPAQAASPTVHTWSNSVDRPYFSCATFEVNGVWEIDHKLTFFYDAHGVAIRDTERIDYRGSFVNQETGASVLDSGSVIYFDTLAPDGSYLTTYSTQVRHSAFIHAAGRIDFQAGTFRGLYGETEAGFSALCTALGE